MSQSVRRGIEQRAQRARDLARLLPRAEVLLADPRQRLDRAEDGLSRGLRLMAERKRSDLARLSAGLRPAVLKGRLLGEHERVARSADRLHPNLMQTLSRKRDALARLRLGAAPIKERLQRQGTDLTRLSVRLNQLMTMRISASTDRLAALDRTRKSLGYQATLLRGYAVVRDGDTVVTSAKVAQKAADLEIEFADGRIKPANP